MAFGIFGGKKKIREATDVTMLLIAPQVQQIDVDLGSPLMKGKALKDRYLLGYLAGASSAVADISNLSHTQMGTVFLNVTERLLGATGIEHVKFHLNSMKQKLETSVVGVEDGYFEVRSLLGIYIGEGKCGELRKLKIHLERQYTSAEIASVEVSGAHIGSVDAPIDNLSWDEWYTKFKHWAGACNEQLRVNDEGRSFLDFLDNKPLRLAHEDKVDPIDLAEEFAAQFDLDSYQLG